MTILLAIFTVSCVSWIITRETVFEDLRAWAKGKRGLYPVSCMYCLAPWVTGLVFIINELPLIYFFPVIWGSYHSLAVFKRVRG
jgi:hypothetical protein